jgi:hypothetical protein
MSVNGFLFSGSGPDGYLRQPKYPQSYDGWLRAGSGNDGYLRGVGPIAPTDTVIVSFPVQYSGLRYFKGTVKELCLVATNDAPAGDQWRVQKNGTTYAVYLVDTTDPNASEIRLQTNDGLKAARLKT